MAQLKGKVAIVTGASAGIGAAAVIALAEAGLNVVGLARRKEKIEALAKNLKAGSGKIYAVRTDVTREAEIIEAFKWTTENVGPVYVLINNAGLFLKTDIIDGDTEKWKILLDTNVLGLTIASREAIKIMRDNSIDGHIVNINSIFGHAVPNYSSFNLYPASKHAITALTETLRLELVRLGSKIKVTSLSPGAVETELLDVSGVTEEQVSEIVKGLRPLDSEDVANAILYVIDTPPHVQVTELTIVPVGQKILGK